jgi:hypothetical protein
LGEYGKSQGEHLKKQFKDMPIPGNGASKISVPDSQMFDGNIPKTHVLESGGEVSTAQKELDPTVSEKLSLKKQASLLVETARQLSGFGAQILDYIVANQKSASFDYGQAVEKTASFEDIRANTADIVERAVYGAELLALELYGRKKQAEAEMPVLPPEGEAGAEGIPPEMMAAGGELPVEGEAGPSQEDAEAAFAQALSENGVDPAQLAGGGAVEGGEGGLDSLQGEALRKALNDAGVSDEEILALIQEMSAEDEAGLSPEEGAMLAADAEKTGSYKCASFNAKRTPKTAEVERKLAKARGVLREICYGVDRSKL